MEKIEYYNDFLLIKSMKSPIRTKGDMITKLLCRNPDRWRIVGITEKALNVFKDSDFKKKPSQRINRSHLKDLFQTYKEMLSKEKEFKNCDDWWDFYYANDETVLSLSSENSKIKTIVKFPIDPQMGLFKNNSSGISWIHNSKEQTFLSELYKMIFLNK